MELNLFVDLLFKKAKEEGFSEYEVYYVDRESLSIGVYKSEVEKYNLNMSYIDSRPSKKELGEYIFYIDFDGHVEDSNVNFALIEIQAYVKMFEILSEGAVCI